MAQINVKNERLNVLCVVSSPHEIAFAEAERISLIFINNLTDLYGENLFPVQNQHEFQFELFVDTKGELLSLIPPPNLSLNPFPPSRSSCVFAGKPHKRAWLTVILLLEFDDFLFQKGGSTSDEPVYPSRC